VSDLIDTTEMYLRTIFELEEEGITALRARIAERLEQSGPTVSQTVSRMERDGLVTLHDDRHLQLTDAGRKIAEQVMRRHRLAECMLVEMLQVPMSQVHEEACRWEHVMSEFVETRILELLNRPTHSPFGNPIPGVALSTSTDLLSLEKVALSLSQDASIQVTVQRLAEPIQDQSEVLDELFAAGVTPNAKVTVISSGEAVEVRSSVGACTLDPKSAAAVFVTLG